MKMWPRHDLENKVTSHEPKVIETLNLRLPGEKLEMQLYAKIGSLSETELGPAKKTTWGVAPPPPPRCGRGLNSIKCIGVISNNTKYKKFIKSRCTLQPYSRQGISWGFLVLITPTIEIKLDLTSNLIETVKKNLKKPHQGHYYFLRVVSVSLRSRNIVDFQRKYTYSYILICFK